MIACTFFRLFSLTPTHPRRGALTNRLLYSRPCAGPALRIRVFASLGMLLSLAVSGTAGDMTDNVAPVAQITRVSAPLNPTLRNDSLVYPLDIFFKNLSGKFWSYLDNLRHNAVIEFYGLEINAPAVQFPRLSPIRKMTVVNQKTKMALTGKLSTVTVTIDQGWNFEVTQPDSSCIRLFFGKKLGVNEIKEENAKKNQRPFFSYLGAFFGAAVALSVVVVAIINK
jgi:hypothetical protein